MDAILKRQIVGLLDEHRIMTIATNRPDGWPQATVVGYTNCELKIYAVIGRTSQKFANITRDPRVSIAIAKDYPRPNDIRGLSMAARAAPVTDPAETDRATQLLLERYPEYEAFMATLHPDVADMVLLRVSPEVVSILDYSKEFGHTDLVTVSASDLQTA